VRAPRAPSATSRYGQQTVSGMWGLTVPADVPGLHWTFAVPFHLYEPYILPPVLVQVPSPFRVATIPPPQVPFTWKTRDPPHVAVAEHEHALHATSTVPATRCFVGTPAGHATSPVDARHVANVGASPGSHAAPLQVDADGEHTRSCAPVTAPGSGVACAEQVVVLAGRGAKAAAFCPNMPPWFWLHAPPFAESVAPGVPQLPQPLSYVVAIDP
jgi:hypothetical protein